VQKKTSAYELLLPASDVGCEFILLPTEVKVSVIVEKGACARDGEPFDTEFVSEHVCPHGVVHRWIRNNGKLANESGQRR
jgi:hypothetical protein